MAILFQSKSLQSQFDELGFVKIPLLKPDEVNRILEYYHNSNFDNKIEGGFHISLDNGNQDVIEKTSEFLIQNIYTPLRPLLEDTKAFTGSFVIKEPGLQNIVPPHQDWTFVDEAKASSATVWVALQDVNEENGALGVISGSHRLFNHIRSSPSPQSKSVLADHIFTLFPFVQIIEMKLGEALIFDNRLIHASPPNLTSEARIAAGIGITQEEAQLIHAFQIPNEIEPKLALFDVEPDFFNSYSNKKLSDLYETGLTPSLPTKDIIPRKVPEYSKSEMEELISGLPGVFRNDALMQKLAILFNYARDSQELHTKNETSENVEAPSEIRGHSFFRVYTPSNIFKEVIWRLKGRP